MDRAMSKLPITHVATTDISEMLDPVPGRRMDLPGFDEEFVDFPDYIIRITERIWHERKVDLCLRYYADDCAIHTLSGDIVGAQTVVDNTHATLAAFPDRRLDADNVIWSDDGEAGFYSSHLITSKMTNLGPSEFGPATGKKIRVMTIADCACRNNKVYEEWLVRDYAAAVMQLGFDVDQTAKKLAQEDIKAGNSLIEFHAPQHAEIMSEESGSMPQSSASQAAQDFVADFKKRIWDARNEDGFANLYDYRVGAQYAGLRNFYGPDEVAPFIDSLLTALPDAKVRIDHIASTPYLGTAEDIAVRWVLAGTHTGDGLYGPASGAPVLILAVSHYRVMNGRIREEITIWDDVAVRRQIETARLSQ